MSHYARFNLGLFYFQLLLQIHAFFPFELSESSKSSCKKEIQDCPRHCLWPKFRCCSCFVSKHYIIKELLTVEAYDMM